MVVMMIKVRRDFVFMMFVLKFWKGLMVMCDIKINKYVIFI